MKFIDVHNHVFPDRIARGAIESMCAGILEPVYWGSRDGLIESMDRSGIDMAVTLPVATKHTQVESCNTFAASHPRDRIIPLGAIHQDTPDPYEVLSGFDELGLRGIKLHSDYQNCVPDDPRMDPIYDACEELGLIVFFHTGLDFYPQTNLASPQAMARVLDKHPNLKAVLAHMGGFRCWDDSEELLVGRDNIYFDSSSCFGLGGMSPERFERMTRAHGVDRVMFGSDGPWEDPAKDIAFITSCDFTEAEKELIFYKNAERFFGATIDDARGDAQFSAN